MFNSEMLPKNIFGINKNEMNMNQAHHTNTGEPSLFNPSEAYLKGNLFVDLYKPYKDYKPATLHATSERDKLFLALSEMAFCAHELNLYLNVHPEDNSMIALFNDYRRETNRLMVEYESKFGPITLSSDALNNTPWLWATQDWPWEGSDHNV
jgi:capsule polysaccharide modification protein KpsS